MAFVVESDDTVSDEFSTHHITEELCEGLCRVIIGGGGVSGRKNAEL